MRIRWLRWYRERRAARRAKRVLLAAAHMRLAEMSDESAADSIYLPEPVYFSIDTHEGNQRAVIICSRYDELAYYQNRPEQYRPLAKADYDELVRQWRERDERDPVEEGWM